jgi:hypothetical protein
MPTGTVSATAAGPASLAVNVWQAGALLSRCAAHAVHFTPSTLPDHAVQLAGQMKAACRALAVFVAEHFPQKGRPLSIRIEDCLP